MKEIKEIVPPVEYKIEGIQVFPDTNSYLFVLSAPKRGLKLVVAEEHEITPLMNCISSRTVEKMKGKHFIGNEINCTLLEKIRGLNFISEKDLAESQLLNLNTCFGNTSLFDLQEI